MVRHNIPLNNLRVFEAAARLLNFTAAAEELHITQAAVSQQIRTLEDHLNTRLFDRLARGLALTSAGQELLSATRPSLDNINNAIDRITGIADRDILTVSTLPSFASRWLIPRLDAFQHEQNDFDLHLHTSGQKIDLLSGNADAAIRLGAREEDGLVREFLLPDAICLVGTPEIKRKLGKKIENLYKQPLSMDGTRFSDSRQRDITGHETELFLESLPLDKNKLNVRVFSASDNVVLTALSGQSTALTRLSLCVDDLDEGRLKILFDLCKPLTQGVSLVYPEFRSDNPTLQRFRNWLITETRLFNDRMSAYYPTENSNSPHNDATSGDNTTVF